jgi:serine/threonine protein kinase
MDKDATDLIDKLLDYAPENRIGMKSKNPFDGYSEIKEHPFFSDIDFSQIESRTMKLPCCIDLFSTHSDSDESSNKRDISSERRNAIATNSADKLRNILDPCCKHRAYEFGKIHYDEEVRVKRKLILTRRRHMVLFVNGKLLLLRHGHIRTEYQIDAST